LKAIYLLKNSNFDGHNPFIIEALLQAIISRKQI